MHTSKKQSGDFTKSQTRLLFSTVFKKNSIQIRTSVKGVIMNKVIKIEGMMCPHCEASVKKALEALEGVSEAKVSHEEGTAIVTLTSDIDDSILTQAVEAKDYKVLGVE